MHCVSSKGGLDAYPNSWLHFVTVVACSIGGSGVDIFFVISGFIITTIVFRPAASGSRLIAAVKFLFRRATRIYPLYWITLAFLVGMANLVSINNPGYHSDVGLPMIFLLTTDIKFQNPAWSLVFELWFYLGTSILMLLPRRFLGAGFLIWGFAQILCLAAHNAMDSFPQYAVLIRPQVMEFFLGCLVARILPRIRLGRARALSLLGVAGLLFTAGWVLCYHRLPSGVLTDNERVLYWGIAASLALPCLAALERGGHLTIPKWLVSLGDYSYSIYLWHYPVMSAFFVWSLNHNLPGTPLIPAAGEFLATLVVAAISYRLIENPSIRLAHRIAG